MSTSTRPATKSTVYYHWSLNSMGQYLRDNSSKWTKIFSILLNLVNFLIISMEIYLIVLRMKFTWMPIGKRNCFQNWFVLEKSIRAVGLSVSTLFYFMYSHIQGEIDGNKWPNITHLRFATTLCNRFLLETDILSHLFQAAVLPIRFRWFGDTPFFVEIVVCASSSVVRTVNFALFVSFNHYIQAFCEEKHSVDRFDNIDFLLRCTDQESYFWNRFDVRKRWLS